MPLVIITFGILLRIKDYLENRSLWLDEAYLALKIIQPSFIEQINRFEELTSITPFGFLAVEHSVVKLFGNNEFSLRAFPLFSGITSLILFYFLLRKFVSGKITYIGLLLFSTSDFLIYYSSELRHYSTELAISIGLSLIILKFNQKLQKEWKYLSIFLLIGSTSVLFSRSAILILAPLGLVECLDLIKNNDRKKALHFFFVLLISLLTFVVYYIVFFSPSYQEKVILAYQSAFIPPFPPFSLTDLKWYLQTFVSIFQNLLGFRSYYVGIFLFFLGMWSLWKVNKKKLLYLIVPIIFTFIISVFKLYPFSHRFLLFLFPFFIILISIGLQYFVEKKDIKDRSLLLIIVISLLLFDSALSNVRNFFQKRQMEEMRPVVKYLQTKIKRGDVIYLYYAALPAYQYYAARFGLDRKYITGTTSREEPDKYIRDLEKLKGNKRIWLIFSHVFTIKDYNEKDFFLSYLRKQGELLDRYDEAGASIYLFDLTQR
ncbi:glycosyltransferase family 39 protein [Candidatus Roizmanbacteria bacterium]|nr:glycosyltransferase family 39 protein [Candidatus Roizmanbacteria bacterium]